MHARLPISFKTNDTVIDTCVVLSPYTSMLMANLKLLLIIFLHWMMWPMFARCACDIHAHVRCVFAARVKRSHITKLSDTSVRCNICSNVMVNKGGNTSNIYLKHCAVFTMSPGSSSNCNSWDTFTSNVDSKVELHSRDTALIRNHKVHYLCVL